jgi:hypothetical protein
MLPSFISEIWGIIFFFIAQISNSITLGIIKLSFLIFSFKLYITQFFNFNSNFIFDTFKQSPTTHTYNTNSKTSTFSLNQNSYFSSETLLLTRSLSKTIYSLNQLRDSKYFENFFLPSQIKTETPIEFLIFETSDFDYKEDVAQTPLSLVDNINLYKPRFNFLNKTIKLNLNSLNDLSNNYFIHNLSNFNIYSNLNHSKQNR